jgi:hypothetical protein
LPDIVLDALDDDRLPWHDRFLPLGSYESRLSGLDGGRSTHRRQVLPAGARTDAQIIEEHSFVAELAAPESPAIAPLAPLAPGGATLHAHGGFRFAVYPKCGGRAPNSRTARPSNGWAGSGTHPRRWGAGAVPEQPALDLNARRCACEWLLARFSARRPRRRVEQHCAARPGRRSPLL